MRDFKQDLAAEKGQDPFWARIFEALFGASAEVLNNHGNNTSQHRGIDGWVQLADCLIPYQRKTRAYTIDDIALEIRHEYRDGSHKPGWLEKPCEAKIFLCGSIPGQNALACSYVGLADAWKRNRKQWMEIFEASARSMGGRHSGDVIDGFQAIRSQNRSYYTHNLCVPLPTFTAEVDTVEIQL